MTPTSASSPSLSGTSRGGKGLIFFETDLVCFSALTAKISESQKSRDRLKYIRKRNSAISSFSPRSIFGSLFVVKWDPVTANSEPTVTCQPHDCPHVTSDKLVHRIRGPVKKEKREAHPARAGTGAPGPGRTAARRSGSSARPPGTAARRSSLCPSAPTPPRRWGRTCTSRARPCTGQRVCCYRLPPEVRVLYGAYSTVHTPQMVHSSREFNNLEVCDHPHTQDAAVTLKAPLRPAVVGSLPLVSQATRFLRPHAHGFSTHKASHEIPPLSVQPAESGPRY